VTVQVHGRNMQVSDQTRKFAEERVEHAARIFDDGGNVDVEFTDRQNPRQADARFRVEITSNAAGNIVRIEAEAADERAALDAAADRYERQLRRLKERLIQRNRRGSGAGNKGLNQPPEQSDVEPDRGERIVRTKRFEMKPMTAEEAALQMEMLGHEFFFFLNGESGEHCVVYHRRDGNVGLIEPE
jgi:putative sigma-54 modulation protein